MPTFDPVADLDILEDSGPHAVPLTGITNGGSGQPVTVTPATDDPALLTNLAYDAATKSITFTPGSLGYGSAVVTVTLTSAGVSVAQTFRVNVARIDHPPVPAPPGSLATFKNEAAGGTLTAADVDSPALAFAVVTRPGHGTLTLGTAASKSQPYVYTPDADYVGPDSFTYLVSDGTTTVDATVSVTVKPTPTLDALGDVSPAENDGTQTVQMSGIAAGTGDPAKLRVTAAVATGPAGLIRNLAVQYTPGASAGTLTFAPGANQYGTATITVTVNDGVRSTSQTFAVKVAHVVQTPTLAGIAPLSLAESETAVARTVNLTGIGTVETAAPVLSVTATSDNPSFLPDPTVAYAPNAATGALTLKLAAGTYGTATVTVTVTVAVADGTASITRQFAVTVASDDDLPTVDPITDRTYDEAEGASTQTVNLTGIGPGDGTSAVSVTAASDNPSLVPDPVFTADPNDPTKGVLTLAPAAGRFGDATVTVTVDAGSMADGTRAKTVATFHVHVLSDNDPPTLDPINDVAYDEAAAATTRMIDLTGLSLGDADPAKFRVGATSGNHALLPDPVFAADSGDATKGTLTLAPAAGGYGTATVTVTATDGTLSVSRQFVVNVNKPPDFAAPADASVPANSGPHSVAITGIDPGGFAGTLRFSTSNPNPALFSSFSVGVSAASGAVTVSFTPAQDQTGSADAAIDLYYGPPGPNQAFVRHTFNVAVTPVPPTLGAIADQTAAENAGTQTVGLTGISTGSDPYSTQLTGVTSTDPALFQTLTVTNYVGYSFGTLSYTPAANAHGSADVTVTVATGTDHTHLARRTFHVTVDQVLPTLAPIADRTAAENAGQQWVGLSGIGAGNDDPSSLSVAASSDNPALFSDLSVDYAPGSSTGTLHFTPTGNAYGTANVTVQVGAGGGADVVTRTFKVTVSHVVQQPTLDRPADVSLAESEDATTRTVDLAGITTVETDAPVLSVTATSDNPSFLPDPAVTYDSGDSTGSLALSLAAGAHGAANVTVTVTVAVADGTASFRRTFAVAVASDDDPPDFVPPADASVPANAGARTVAITGIDPGDFAGTLSFSAANPDPTLFSAFTVAYDGGTTATVTFTPAQYAYGSTVATVDLHYGNGSVVEHTFDIAVNPSPPTLDPVANQNATENAPEQSVGLTGVSAGSDDPATLAVTAAVTGGDAGVLADAHAAYDTTSGTWSVFYTPAANAYGAAEITVTASADSSNSFVDTVSRTFDVVVAHVVQQPTLDRPADVSLAESEDATTRTVDLAGITTVETDAPVLSVTATSDNPSFLPDPAVTYDSGDSTGSLALSLAAGAHGAANVTVTVTVAVADGTASFRRTFAVAVASDDDPPDFIVPTDVHLVGNGGEQRVAITGIDPGDFDPSTLQFVNTANPDENLFQSYGVSYTPGDTTAYVTFTPAYQATGSATVTLDLAYGDGTQFVQHQFGVTVDAEPPSLDPISDQEVAENAGRQYVTLTGVSFGTDDPSTLNVSASVTGGTGVLADAGAAASFNSTGGGWVVSYLPAPNSHGTDAVTVTVSAVNTGGGVDTFSETFGVTVDQVPPTIDPVADQTVDENAGQQSVALSGIGAGNDDPSSLRVTAVSSDNPALFSDLHVDYTPGDATGTLFFTAAKNAYGSATVTVTVSAAGGIDATTETFLVTVNHVVQPPTLNPLSEIDLTEGVNPETVPLAGIGTIDAASSTLSVSATTDNPALVRDLGVSYNAGDPTGSLAFTTPQYGTGTAHVTVSVTDGTGLVTTQSFAVVVSADPNAPDHPTLDPIADITVNDTDGPQTVDLTDITAGASGDPIRLTVSVASDNPGLVSGLRVSYSAPDPAGTLTFTPMPGSFGSATITITVFAPNGGNGSPYNDAITQAFVLTVNPVVPPSFDVVPPLTVAESDDLTNSQSFAVTGIAAGDGTAANLQVYSAIYSGPPGLVQDYQVSYGAPDGHATISYTLGAGLSGTAYGYVEVYDGLFATVKYFTITVASDDDLPTLDPISDQTYVESDDATTQTVTLTGIGPGDGTSAVSVTAASDNGTLLPDPVFTADPSDPTKGTLTLAPAAGAFGDATVSVTVDAGLMADGTPAETVETFRVHVNSDDDPPTINPIPDATYAESDDATTQTVSLTGIGPGDGTSAVSVTATSDNTALLADPVFTADPNDPTKGTLTLAPVAGAFGDAIVTVMVDAGFMADGTPAETVETFRVHITSDDDLPTLDPISDQTYAESDDATTQTVTLTGIGPGDGTSAVSVTAASDNGTLLPDPVFTADPSDPTKGTLTLAPAAGAFGDATVSVTVDAGLMADGTPAETVETFRVHITSDDDLPTLDPISDQTYAESDDATTQTVTLTGIGPGDGTSAVSVTAASDNGTLLPDPVFTADPSDPTKGTLTLAPAAGAFGDATVSVTVDAGLMADGTPAETVETFRVHVNSDDDPPDFVPPADIVVPANSGSHTVAITGIDPGDYARTLSVSSANPDPALFSAFTVSYQGGNTASLTFTPAPYAHGSAAATIRLNYGRSGAFVERSFGIAVNPTPPAANPIPDQEVAENAGRQYVTLAGVTFGSDDPSTLDVTASVTGATGVLADAGAAASFNSTGGGWVVSYLPAPNSHGTDAVTVTVSASGPDGVDTFSETFGVTVDQVPPTLDPVPDRTVNENAGQQSVALTGVGPGRDAPESLRLTAAVTGGDSALLSGLSVDYAGGPQGTLHFTPTANDFGTATVTVTASAGGGADVTTRTFVVTVRPVVQPPTLDGIGPVPLAESETTVARTVDLTGIGTVETDSPVLSVTATSSNHALLADPAVTYASGDAAGSLTFTPAAGAFGTATVTVTVTVAVPDGTASFSRTFAVTVASDDDQPTLDPIADQFFAESDDATARPLSPTGISPGDGTAALKVTAKSDNPSLLPNPRFAFDPNDPTKGVLTLAPAAGRFGDATVTVTVDAGLMADGTPAKFVETFHVHVASDNDPPTLAPIQPVTIPEYSPRQTVPLAGITLGDADPTKFKLTATSDNPTLLTGLTTSYAGGAAVSTLAFTPADGAYGSGTVTVTVSDGTLSATRQFLVTVNRVARPNTLDALPAVTVNEDSGTRTVNLTGIASRNGAPAGLVVSVATDNPALIAGLSASYAAPNSTGSVTFAPERTSMARATSPSPCPTA